MITKTIEGREFKLREKKEITWGAENRAREFIKKHILEIDSNAIGMMKGVKTEGSDVDLDLMLSNPSQLAEYMQAVEEQKEKNTIAAIMLVTNLEYSVLEELQVTVMSELKKEVIAIVKDATDFLNGLGISTQSKLMTESPLTPEVKSQP